MGEKLYTTFRLLAQHGASPDGYANLAAALGGEDAYGLDTAIPIWRVLDLNGYDDAIWALRAVPPEQEALRNHILRLHAEDSVCGTPLPDGVMGGDLSMNEASRDAAKAAERAVLGAETPEELRAAWEALAWLIAGRLGEPKDDANAAYAAARAWQAKNLRIWLGAPIVVLGPRSG